MDTSPNARAAATRTDRSDDSGQLFDRCRHGDRAALGTLLERSLPRLRVFVRLQVSPWLREQESCSDLVQSVCRELLAGMEGFEFRGEEQLRSWLFATALNKIRQHERYHRADKRDPARLQQLDDELSAAYATTLSPSQRAIAKEDIERLEKGFEQLPEHYRQVITLSRVAGLPQEEVARAMGRSVPSVRNLLSRALSRLAGLVVE